MKSWSLRDFLVVVEVLVILYVLGHVQPLAGLEVLLPARVVQAVHNGFHGKVLDVGVDFRELVVAALHHLLLVSSLTV